jgi:YD repeat-containing protein
MELTYVNGHYEIYRYDNITYEFNASNQLVSMSEPNGNAISFSYDSSNGNLQSVSTSNGDVITFSYDSMNRLTTALLPDGTEVRYEYTTASNGSTVLSEVDVYNQGLLLEREFTYDTNGLLSGIEVGENNEYSLTYTANAAAETVTYPDADVMQMGYTSGLTSTTNYVGGDTNEISSASSCTYSNEGNILSTTDPDGQVIYYTYDNNYNLTSLSYTYDEDSFDETNGLTQTSVTDTYTYTYDDHYNVLTVTDPDGVVTTYDGYNTLNKPTVLTISGGGTSSTTGYSYDSYGNLTSVTDPSGATVYYTYDDDDTGVDGSLTSTTDRYGNTTYYVYNNDGQLVQTSLSNISASILSYDDMWRPTETVDANGIHTTYTYDYLGNVASMTLAYGTSDAQTYYYYYNDNNQIASIYDPLNQQITYSYDELGREVGYTIGGETYTVEYSSEDLTVTDTAFLGEDFGTITYQNAMKVTEKLPNGTANQYQLV